MFWRKSKDEAILMRNKRYAVAYGVFHNRVHDKIGGIDDFKVYMSNPQIINLIEGQYNECLRVLKYTDAGEYVAYIIVQQNRNWQKYIDSDEVEQLGWGFNAARDIIFSFAPAIAKAGGKSVEGVTGLMMEAIIERISEGEMQHDVEPFLLALRGVRSTFEELNGST